MHEHPETLILALQNAQQIRLYQKCEENVFKVDNEWYTFVSMKKKNMNEIVFFFIIHHNKH